MPLSGFPALLVPVEVRFLSHDNKRTHTDGGHSNPGGAKEPNIISPHRRNRPHEGFS